MKSLFLFLETITIENITDIIRVSKKFLKLIISGSIAILFFKVELALVAYYSTKLQSILEPIIIDFSQTSISITIFLLFLFVPLISFIFTWKLITFFSNVWNELVSCN